MSISNDTTSNAEKPPTYCLNSIPIGTPGRKLDDLTGRQFGKWIVLAHHEIRSDHSHFWMCRCECGTERSVRGSQLKIGRTKSCRACTKSGRPRIDYVGRKFGKWTVIRFSRDGNYRARYWLCRCECGFEQDITCSRLNSSEIGGCRKCRAKTQRRKAYKRIWNTIKKNAMVRDLEFSIDPDYAFGLLANQGNHCKISGMPIWIADANKDRARDQTTASLDRIDSSLGYIVGNVQWLHKDVNKMKWDLSQDRFLEICRMIARRQDSDTNT